MTAMENKAISQIKELLLFCEPDGEVVNGFRTKDIINEMREMINGLDGRGALQDKLSGSPEEIINRFAKWIYGENGQLNPSEYNVLDDFLRIWLKLEAPDRQVKSAEGDPEILIKALEHIGKWGDEEEERWDDPGDCAMDALSQYRYSMKNYSK